MRIREKSFHEGFFSVDASWILVAGQEVGVIFSGDFAAWAETERLIGDSGDPEFAESQSELIMDEVEMSRLMEQWDAAEVAEPIVAGLRKLKQVHRAEAAGKIGRAHV